MTTMKMKATAVAAAAWQQHGSMAGSLATAAVGAAWQQRGIGGGRSAAAAATARQHQGTPVVRQQRGGVISGDGSGGGEG
jgi:hypothetical protein